MLKNLIIGGLVFMLVVIGAYFGYQSMLEKRGQENMAKPTVVDPELVVEENEPVVEEVDETKTVIGTSADGNQITAYHYGEGDKDVLFVGGIHGGYSWNTALLAYEFMEHLEKEPNFVPEGVRVTIIPVLNPDGLEKIVGTTSVFAQSDVPTGKDVTIPGRFNGNNVDLNRNFDCDWQEEGMWQNRTVSGGDEAFSEPEAKAMRDYIEANKPDAVVVWYSASGGVFASNCHGEVLAKTSELTQLYAKAAGYKAFEDFNFYEITGDMVNWLAKERIPAISVLLTTHEVVEWDKNKKGIEALLNNYKD